MKERNEAKIRELVEVVQDGLTKAADALEQVNMILQFPDQWEEATEDVVEGQRRLSAS